MGTHGYSREPTGTHGSGKKAEGIFNDLLSLDSSQMALGDTTRRKEGGLNTEGTSATRILARYMLPRWMNSAEGEGGTVEEIKTSAARSKTMQAE